MTSRIQSPIYNKCLSPEELSGKEEENSSCVNVCSPVISFLPSVSITPTSRIAPACSPKPSEGNSPSLSEKQTILIKAAKVEEKIKTPIKQPDPLRSVKQTSTKIAKVKNSLDGLNLSLIRSVESKPPLSIKEKISGLFAKLQLHQENMLKMYASIESPPRISSTSHEHYFPIHFEGGSLRLVKRIGAGAYGQVYHAQLFTDFSEKILDVALKVSKVFKSCEETLKTISRLKDEALLIKKLSHADAGADFPIAKVLSDFPINSSSYCIVEELYECSIFEVLRRTKNSGISLSLTYKIIKQLLHALEILETTDDGVVHCDLKPENIVLENSFSSKIKLIDFGISVVGPDQNLDKKYLVSRFYRSPEILFHMPFHTSSDRWSLGLIAFELFIGRPLFLARDTLELVCMIDDFLGPLPDRLLEEIAEKVHPKCKKGSLIDLEEEKSRYKRYQNPNDLFDYAFSEDYLRYKNDERFDPSHTLENFDLFKSFIKCFLTLDPAERLTIEAARVHPFMLTMQDLLPSKTA